MNEKNNRDRAAAVQSTSETRADLTKILAEFRRQGKDAEPIMFGTQRKPEAVLMPAWMWKRMADELDDANALLTAIERTSSPQKAKNMTHQQFRAWMAEMLQERFDLENATAKESSES